MAKYLAAHFNTFMYCSTCNCDHTYLHYDAPASVLLCTYCINPWTTGASVAPDWINICDFVVRLLVVVAIILQVVANVYCDYRFVAYVTPCAICIHYANSQPRGLEV